MGGRTWKGPKHLGRNLWGSNLKRAETSGNQENELKAMFKKSIHMPWSRLHINKKTLPQFYEINLESSL